MVEGQTNRNKEIVFMAELQEKLDKTEFWPIMEKAGGIYATFYALAKPQDDDTKVYLMDRAVEASLGKIGDVSLGRISAELKDGWAERLANCYGVEFESAHFVLGVERVIKGRSSVNRTPLDL